MNIQDAISAIQEKRIRITDHADEEAQADTLTFDEIFFSVLQGEVIEDYPTDKPYPSCLIYGNNFEGEPIHSVWAYNEKTRWAVFIPSIVLTQIAGSICAKGESNETL
jgi:hypothetical protein